MYTGYYAKISELAEELQDGLPTCNCNIVFRSKKIMYSVKFKFDYAFVPYDKRTLSVKCHFVTTASETVDTPYEPKNAENYNLHWIASAVVWNRPGIYFYDYGTNIGYNSGFDTKEEAKDFIKQHSNITDDDVICWLFVKNIYEQDYELVNLSHTFSLDYSNFKYSKYSKLDEFDGNDFVLAKQCLISCDNKSYYVEASLLDWTELSRYTFMLPYMDTLGRRRYPFAIRTSSDFDSCDSDDHYVKKYNGSYYKDVLNVTPTDFDNIPDEAFIYTRSKAYEPAKSY